MTAASDDDNNGTCGDNEDEMMMLLWRTVGTRCSLPVSALWTRTTVTVERRRSAAAVTSQRRSTAPRLLLPCLKVGQLTPCCWRLIRRCKER